MDLFRVICSLMVRCHQILYSGGFVLVISVFSLTIRFIVYGVSQIRTQYLLEMDIKYAQYNKLL